MAAVQIITWILACIGAICVVACFIFVIMAHRYSKSEGKRDKTAEEKGKAE